MNIKCRLAKLEQRPDTTRPPEPAPPGWLMIGRGLLVPEPMTVEQWAAACR